METIAQLVIAVHKKHNVITIYGVVLGKHESR